MKHNGVGHVYRTADGEQLSVMAITDDGVTIQYFYTARKETMSIAAAQALIRSGAWVLVSDGIGDPKAAFVAGGLPPLKQKPKDNQPQPRPKPDWPLDCERTTQE